MPPILHLPGALEGAPRSHAFLAADPRGWRSVAVSEWELTGEEWVDRHPHDEVNYVLEGTLVVECDGETIEAPQGSVVHVPAGSTGRYRAPDHARMLAIYGPNPDGAPTEVGGLRRLEPEQDTDAG